MTTLKIDNNDISKMLQLYDEEWFTDLNMIVHLNDSDNQLLIDIFPLLDVFCSESVKELYKGTERKRNISDIIRVINRIEERDCSKNINNILTQDFNVCKALKIFLSQMIWNDKLLQCAQIIRKYPLEERERICRYIDWLFIHGFYYNSDFRTILDPIKGIEIIGENTDYERSQKWLKEWYEKN